MNDEQRQEQSSLYVLGLLTGDELAAFAQALEADAELRGLVFAFTESLHLLAGSVPPAAPPPELRSEILRGFAALKETPEREESAEKPKPPVFAPLAVLPDLPGKQSSVASRLRLFIPWAAAAVLALCWLQQISESKALKVRAEAAQQEISKRQALTGKLLAAADQRNAESKTAAEALQSARLQVADLSAARTALTAEIAALKSAGSFDKTRIALLSSQLKTRPQAVAATVWNQAQQDGLLVVENLPALAKGRDYQLWVIDSSGDAPAPVSAGIFKVDAKGGVRIQFKPAQSIGTADKFAVTIEKEGGSTAPTLTQLVVIGG